MEELKFIGAEDGYVIVTTESGMQYRLPVTDELRAAIVDSSRHIEHTDNLPRPRDVQSQLRSGATVKQVAEQYGVEEHFVARFAAPVFAELEHMVDLAKSIAVDSVDDDNVDTFGALVTTKLNHAEAQHVTWSAWREQDRRWIVQVEYLLATMEHDCRWELDPRHRQLTPLNSSAQTLSGDEPLTPAHERQLHPVAPMFTSYADASQPSKPSKPSDAGSRSNKTTRDHTGGPDEPRKTTPLRDLSAAEKPAASAFKSSAPETGANVTQIGDAFKQRDDATQTMLDRLDRQRGQRQAPPTDATPDDELDSSERDPSGPLPLAQIQRELAQQSRQANDVKDVKDVNESKQPTSDPLSPEATHAEATHAETTHAVGSTTSSGQDTDIASQPGQSTEPDLLSKLETVTDFKSDSLREGSKSQDHSHERPRSSKRRTMPSWDEIVFGSHPDHD